VKFYISHQNIVEKFFTENSTIVLCVAAVKPGHCRTRPGRSDGIHVGLGPTPGAETDAGRASLPPHLAHVPRPRG